MTPAMKAWTGVYRAGEFNPWDRHYSVMHIPTNGYYVIVGTAIREVDLEPVLIYMERNSSVVWVRPAVDFFDAKMDNGLPKWTWGLTAAHMMDALHKILCEIMEERNVDRQRGSSGDGPAAASGDAGEP